MEFFVNNIKNKKKIKFSPSTPKGLVVFLVLRSVSRGVLKNNSVENYNRTSRITQSAVVVADIMLFLFLIWPALSFVNYESLPSDGKNLF